MAALYTSGNRVLQTGPAAVFSNVLGSASVAAQTGGNTPPNDDSAAFPPGLYFPPTITLAQGNSWQAIATGFVRGLAGIPRFFLTGPDAALFILGGQNGCQLACPGVQHNPYNTQTSFSITVNATDGITTYHQAVSLPTAVAGITNSCNVAWDTAGVKTANNNQTIISNPQTFGNSADPTLSDPRFLYQGFYYQTAGSVYPLATHYGTYPITVTTPSSGGNVTSPTVFYVAAESAPIVQFTGPKLYSTAQPGDAVGQVAAYSDVGIISYGIQSAGSCLSINAHGQVVVCSALTPGIAQSATIRVTSTTGKVKDQVILFDVLPGTLLPASNMSFAPAALANYTPTAATVPVVVGTPTLPAMTGTITWTLKQDHTCANMEAAGQPRRYQIDAGTGQITAVTILSAQTDNLTITAVSGSQYCVATFPVVVAAYAGPLIFVGQGMTNTASAAYTAAVAAYGPPAYTYEHWFPCYYQFSTYGDCSAAFAGAHVYVFANTDANYYANDCTNTQNYAFDTTGARYGTAGPVTIEGVPLSGKFPRFGGPFGSGQGGGVDAGGKGFLVLNNGDFVIRNLEFSDIHASGYQGDGVPSSSSTGCGIRQNGQTYGNVTIDNCYFHDCDQGFESSLGTGELTVTNSEFVNCGGVYVGSGATHNMYFGAVWKVTMSNVLSYRSFNGHTMKCRAMASDISNCRFYDSERGGASNQIDFANGGNHVVRNCVIQKGPFAQNPAAINFCEDMQDVDFPVNSLLVHDTVFINNGPPNLTSAAIYMAGTVSSRSGQFSTATSLNNTYFGWPLSELGVGSYSYRTDANTDIINSPVPAVSVINPTLATGAQPALDFSHPFNATGYTGRPGAFYFPYDGESRNNFIHSSGGQIDPGIDDIRISGSAAVGSVILPRVTATGAPYYMSNPAQPDIRINPFVAGTVWTLVYDAQTYTIGPLTTAPAGRYVLTASPDGTSAVLTVGAALTAGTYDWIIIRATAPTGIVIQNLIYIVIV